MWAGTKRQLSVLGSVVKAKVALHYMHSMQASLLQLTKADSVQQQLLLTTVAAGLLL